MVRCDFRRPPITPPTPLTPIPANQKAHTVSWPKECQHLRARSGRCRKGHT